MSRIGLVIIVGALATDLVLRLMPAAQQHMGHRPDEHVAHVVALVAMALVMVGVVIDGSRRQRSRRRSSHAHR